MSRKSNRSGPSPIEATLVVALVGMLGLAVYVVRHSPTLATASPVTATIPSTAPTTKALSVVALGDSITQMDSDAAAGVRGTGWFPRVLEADSRLAYSWNAGVHGNTTAQMRARVDADALSRRPDVVFILGGTNDVGQHLPVGTTVANLRAIVEQVKVAGARAVLFTIPPRADPAFTSAISTLNLAIRKLAQAEGVPVVDLHDAVATTSGIYAAGDSKDGVHPSEAGSAAMAAAAVTQLNVDGL